MRPTPPAPATRSMPASSPRGWTASRWMMRSPTRSPAGRCRPGRPGGTDGQATADEVEALGCRTLSGHALARESPRSGASSVSRSTRPSTRSCLSTGLRRAGSTARSAAVVAGGKAANAVRAARHLGLPGALVAVLGGHAGAWYRDSLAEPASRSRVLRRRRDADLPLRLRRGDGTLTELYEPGVRSTRRLADRRGGGADALATLRRDGRRARRKPAARLARRRYPRLARPPQPRAPGRSSTSPGIRSPRRSRRRRGW